MRPYNDDFIVNQMGKYLNLIKEQKNNDYSITINKINSDKGYMYVKESVKEIDEIVLKKKNELIMKLNEKEIQGTYNIIKNAYGKVGIVGLGLGYSVQEIINNPRVDSIIVYELSNEIIDIYKNNFMDNPKVTIIHGDAFKAQPEKFDTFFCDIYAYELSNKVVEDYKKFNELHEIEEYYFWGMEHFMLSCAYDDLLWVYIPENWVESSKALYEAIDMAGKLNQYYQLDADKVRKILMEFKEILNA